MKIFDVWVVVLLAVEFAGLAGDIQRIAKPLYKEAGFGTDRVVPEPEFEPGQGNWDNCPLLLMADS